MRAAYDEMRRVARPGTELFRAVRARDRYGAIAALARDAKQPGIAAHLAVLHEAALDVPLEVHVHVLSAVGAVDDEILFHQPARHRFGRRRTSRSGIGTVSPNPNGRI